MATIKSKGIVREMLDNDGVFAGDPQAYAIYEYRVAGMSDVEWAVYWALEDIDLARSPRVGAYILLWSRDTGHVGEIGVLED